MRAGVLYGPKDLRVEEVAEPPAPGVGEVTIAVHRCGLCGTDLHEFSYGGPMTPLAAAHPWSGHAGPTVIGHEFMGTVSRAGARTSLSEGDRVVAGAGRWCGGCAPCRTGRTNLCEHYFTYGLSTHGGMASFVTVPEVMCVPVPDNCTDGNAVLAQPVAIAMHALDRAAPPAGSAVLVVGAGAVGALLVAAAADAGLAVHVVDLDAGRLDAARRLGATATGLIEPAVGTSPFRGISTVFETSGSAAGLGLALTAAAPGGRIVAVGLPARPVEFDSRTAVVSEVDVITSSAHVCQRDLPAAVGLLSRRRLDEVIVAQVIGLDRIVSDGLARMASGAVRGKTVVDVLAPC
jgi:(R,R)-butanediol dehydrogenase/meso-butanediol dehydrogenase/diacetyl reductase